MTEGSSSKWLTWGGIVFAFAAPFAAWLFTRAIFGSSQSASRVELGLALHWLTFAAMIFFVLRLERLPLASIGVRPVRWWTMPLGVVLGVVIAIGAGLLVQVTGLKTDAGYAEGLQALPFVLRLAVAVTAGVFEETLYRGYALERLAALSGNRWIAAAGTLLLFTVAHAPAVGWAHLLPVGVVATLVTLLYLWRRDLVLNIVVHTTIDSFGLLLAPMMAHGGAGQ